MKRFEFPVLPLWNDTLLGDTFHLTNEEYGCYMRLLQISWRALTCELEADDAILARMARCTPRQWARLKPAVIGFFHIARGKMRHAQLRKERAFQISVKRRQSKKGRARALKSLETPSAASQPNGSRTAAGSQPDRSRTPALSLSPSLSPSPKEERKEGRKKDAACAAPEKALFDLGKQVLGANAGGLVAKLLKSLNGDIARCTEVVDVAGTKADPREYVGAVIRSRERETDEERRFWATVL